MIEDAKGSATLLPLVRLELGFTGETCQAMFAVWVKALMELRSGFGKGLNLKTFPCKPLTITCRLPATLRRLPFKINRPMFIWKSLVHRNACSPCSVMGNERDTFKLGYVDDGSFDNQSRGGYDNRDVLREDSRSWCCEISDDQGI